MPENLFTRPVALMVLLSLSLSVTAFAQDNSPYSRYGLGDVSGATNVTSRAMGGISAGYSDLNSINFSNPASYSQFQAWKEKRSKRISAGQVVFDVGMNFDNRTLIQPNTTNRFTSADAFFSYLQLGMPLRKNWGLSFGIRPVSRISYLINRDEYLMGSNPNDTIERAITQFRGSGGSYLPSIGTGFAIGKISAGLNVGYLFGSRENTTLRSLVNDSVLYYSSDHTTKTSFGSVFFNAGLQFADTISNTKDQQTLLRIGVSGNWEQKLNGSQDILRQTFTRGTAGEELQIDSVFQQNNQHGVIVYPASYKAGFTVQHIQKKYGNGYMFGADFATSQWNNYRFFGQQDSVQNNWQLSIGAQLYPRPRSNYFSHVIYRAGFFIGPDYIKVGKDLPTVGGSFGMGLPIGNYNRMSPNQRTMLNISLEYGKRGNNSNLLKENLFRISVGFNFTDIWFGKKQYD
jgi:hypothetical protein